MSKETVKCGYKHCWHESRDVLRESATKINGRYYHSDCAMIRTEINEIKQLYCIEVDKNVSIPLLAMVLNNLIFIKGVDTKYILFGLKDWIKYNKKLIKSPFTLYYLQDNERLTRIWNNRQEIT